MFLINSSTQFLVKLKIMDYSLLLGIHDVGRAEREEEAEEVSNEEEQEAENGQAPATAVGSYGTSPEGIASYMLACKPLGPGEFDPYVDVYAIRSCAGGYRGLLGADRDHRRRGWFPSRPLSSSAHDLRCTPEGSLLHGSD